MSITTRLQATEKLLADRLGTQPQASSTTTLAHPTRIPIIADSLAFVRGGDHPETSALIDPKPLHAGTASTTGPNGGSVPALGSVTAPGPAGRVESAAAAVGTTQSAARIGTRLRRALGG